MSEMNPPRYTANARAEKRVWGSESPSITRGEHFGYRESGRHLFAAGKSVITTDGTRATSMEFLGRKQNMPSPAVLELHQESLTEILAQQNAEEADEFAAMHFDDGCDDCESSRDAFWHEMARMAGEED